MIAVAEKIPEAFHIDEGIERILFITRVEEAFQEITNGKGTPHEEIERMVTGRLKILLPDHLPDSCHRRYVNCQNPARIRKTENL